MNTEITASPTQLDESAPAPQVLDSLARAVKKWDDHTGFLPCPPNMLYLLTVLKQEGFTVHYQPQASAGSQAA